MKNNMILKTSMLLLALIGVIYGIRALNSGTLETEAGDPNSFIGSLLGADQKLFNWCPLKTEKVEIFTRSGEVESVKSEPVDISSLCEIAIGNFATTDLEKAEFALKLRAHGSRGEVTELFASANGLYRVQDMPFSSAVLTKVLGRLSTPSSL